jgi:nicotinamide mononucleotide adenylyltransferase
MTATAQKPKRVKTPEETVDGVRRQIKSLEKRAETEDPWMMAEMFDMATELEAAAVRTMARLRAKGYTWKDIALSYSNETGAKVSGQTLIKRYAARVNAVQL